MIKQNSLEKCIVIVILQRFFLFSVAVGSFRATMRELADDLMLSSNTNVIVDSRESAMAEAGEIIQSKV